MKESKLIQMEQRLMQIAKLLNQVADEQSHLRNLAVGTLKTIQKFKGEGYIVAAACQDDCVTKLSIKVK